MRVLNVFEKQKLLTRIFVSCCCLLLQASLLHAQEGARQVSGKVTDKATGEPLPGVTIALRKGKAAATTDRDGSFSLQVLPGENLMVSFIGYTGQEVHTNGVTFLNITLEKDYYKMDEVVVIGYGTARKKNVVGALDIVSAKDAGATTAINPSQLLIGKSAGVQVVQSDGSPGADAQIIIRGTGSFTSVDPLYVIDGIQGDYSWRKYEYYDLVSSYGGPQSPINGQIIRFADVLLMLAEAHIQQSDIGSVPLGLINRVRQRAGAVAYASLGASQTAAMVILMRERQLELCGEQSRYFDLIRWGIAKQTINGEKAIEPGDGKQPFQDKNVLLPIPDNEKNYNPNVTVSDGWN